MDTNAPALSTSIRNQVGHQHYSSGNSETWYQRIDIFHLFLSFSTHCGCLQTFRHFGDSNLRKSESNPKISFCVMCVTAVKCLFYSSVFEMIQRKSVNGVVVTWNPSKVQLGVRFPLNAYFFYFHFFHIWRISKLRIEKHWKFDDQYFLSVLFLRSLHVLFGCPPRRRRDGSPR